ncbi:MAG TPA: hypothetical protein VM123_03805 [archaeon]|nr:hypothetical protein [archaeon]
MSQKKITQAQNNKTSLKGYCKTRSQSSGKHSKKLVSNANPKVVEIVKKSMRENETVWRELAKY